MVLTKDKIVEVAAGVIIQDGRMLITHRPASSHLGGLWEFPGGKRMAGETLEDCLRRELHEELGLSIRVEGILKVVDFSYPDRRVRLHFYRCSIPNQNTPLPNRLTCRWVLPSDLSQYEFPEANSSLIQDLQGYS